MKPYIPDELPIKGLNYERLIKLVAQANAKVAEYDGLLQGIVNPGIMLSPLTNQEAVLSSKIEGTQATVDEVLEYEAGIQKIGENKEDIREILNYRQALLTAKKHLQTRPITLHLIKQIHERLLDSVRGKNISPGQFRTDQNWIGKPGCSIEKASFVPPSPLILQEYLDKWHSYLSNSEEESLLQTAVMHAQFELIHPFKDGNGRIGRILIPLFLYKKKKIKAPIFYLSQELESNRERYYSKLQNISTKKDWNEWVEFFLKSIINQANRNIHTVGQIMVLYDDMSKKIQDITHSQYTIDILHAIFSKPIFQASDIGKQFKDKMTRAHCSKLLTKLKDNGILNVLQESKGRRSAILCFSALINLVEGKKIL